MLTRCVREHAHLSPSIEVEVVHLHLPFMNCAVHMSFQRESLQQRREPEEPGLPRPRVQRKSCESRAHTFLATEWHDQ